MVPEGIIVRCERCKFIFLLSYDGIHSFIRCICGAKLRLDCGPVEYIEGGEYDEYNRVDMSTVIGDVYV